MIEQRRSRTEADEPGQRKGAAAALSRELLNGGAIPVEAYLFVRVIDPIRYPLDRTRRPLSSVPLTEGLRSDPVAVALKVRFRWMSMRDRTSLE